MFFFPLSVQLDLFNIESVFCKMIFLKLQNRSFFVILENMHIRIFFSSNYYKYIYSSDIPKYYYIFR